MSGCRCTGTARPAAERCRSLSAGAPVSAVDLAALDAEPAPAAAEVTPPAAPKAWPPTGDASDSDTSCLTLPPSASTPGSASRSAPATASVGGTGPGPAGNTAPASASPDLAHRRRRPLADARAHTNVPLAASTLHALLQHQRRQPARAPLHWAGHTAVVGGRPASAAAANVPPTPGRGPAAGAEARAPAPPAAPRLAEGAGAQAGAAGGAARAATAALVMQLLPTEDAGVPAGAGPAATMAGAAGAAAYAAANQAAGGALAGLAPGHLALLIAASGRDAALAQALLAALAALDDAALGAIGRALQALHAASRAAAAAAGAPSAAINVGPALLQACAALSPRARSALAFCRHMLGGGAAAPLPAAAAGGWAAVVRGWAGAAELAADTTPALALHLWARVEPLVRPPPPVPDARRRCPGTRCRGKLRDAAMRPAGPRLRRRAARAGLPRGR